MRHKTFQTIEYSEAKRIIDAIVDKLMEEGKAAVVAVADTHGELIAFARMDGAPDIFYSDRCRIKPGPPLASVSQPKKSATKSGIRKRASISHITAIRNFVGWGGGLPVWRDRQVVGAVAVSGLPSEEDIRLATLGAELVE